MEIFIPKNVVTSCAYWAAEVKASRLDDWFVEEHLTLHCRFLEDVRVPAGEWLLHNGASSVLGRELIQMAKRRGTKLINVVRRREAVAELEKLGCAHFLFAVLPSACTCFKLI